MIHIGTSGWQYRHWKGAFYPRKPRPADDLAFFAEHFQTVETNGTFYRLPARSTFEDWARRTPQDFVFAVKASRFLTHIKRLKDAAAPVELLLERGSGLGAKLGPVLLQLPPDFQCDVARLGEALAAFPRGVRVAVEFRHASWFVRDVRRELERHGAALCMADRGSRLLTPAWDTAGWCYVRFHEGMAAPRPCYGATALESRAELIAQLHGAAADGYVYFNNDTRACALRDAGTFARVAEAAGLAVTRTPGTRNVRVG